LLSRLSIAGRTTSNLRISAEHYSHTHPHPINRRPALSLGVAAIAGVLGVMARGFGWI